MALITAQRVQSIHQFDLSTMLKGEQKLAFKLELLKQSRPSIKSPIIEIVKYPHCKKICVMDALLSYIKTTETLREDETKLSLTHQRPYHAACSSTISRWIKSALTLAGIDTHSTRAASSSAAMKAGEPVSDILSAGGWSSERTFARHYNVHVEDPNTFAEAFYKS